MVSQNVKINNPTGLDVKPAGALCREAMKFKCKITFVYGGQNTANAKSVLSVLGASVKCGEEIQLVCEGEDEVQALSHLAELFDKGLED